MFCSPHPQNSFCYPDLSDVFIPRKHVIPTLFLSKKKKGIQNSQENKNLEGEALTVKEFMLESPGRGHFPELVTWSLSPHLWGFFSVQGGSQQLL